MQEIVAAGVFIRYNPRRTSAAEFTSGAAGENLGAQQQDRHAGTTRTTRPPGHRPA
jgi:hypothetical protein